METLKITPDPDNQFSSFMLDHLMPIYFTKNQSLDLRVNFYMKPLLQTINLIMALGEQEHMGDWDPSVRICFRRELNYDDLETEPGYYNMAIQGDKLLLEDAEEQAESQDSGEDYYHTINIMDIESITILRN